MVRTMTDEAFRKYLQGLSDSELEAVDCAVRAVLQGSRSQVYQTAGIIAEVIRSRE